MNTLPVVEHFISINGEGRRAGQLALFIRFAGCNLNCEYCDTKWANEPGVHYEAYAPEKLAAMAYTSGIRNITLTGGEPLLQPGMQALLHLFRQQPKVNVEIETNGSVDIVPFMEKGQDNVTFTLDYKTGASGMEDKMCLSNYRNLRNTDTVKFVVGSRADMERAKEIIETYRLKEKGCGIYLSPCFGKIEPVEIVEFLVENRMNEAALQLQLHKFIWDPDKRGV